MNVCRHSHILVPPPVPPQEYRFQDFVLTLLLAGGVAYGLYALVKHWIISLFMQASNDQTC